MSKPAVWHEWTKNPIPRWTEFDGDAGCSTTVNLTKAAPDDPVYANPDGIVARFAAMKATLVYWDVVSACILEAARRSPELRAALIERLVVMNDPETP